MAGPANQWAMSSPCPAAAQPAGGEEMGLQTRPMGLKVQYTFDRESMVNCLARWPHLLQIQTMPLDEKTTIGVVDLRICLQAIAQCSPEILNLQENDFSVYAYDYSEPDVPLVGQGMLSWTLDPRNGTQQPQPQLVTGRVTRSVLTILNNGSRDTLEVKLKLIAVARMVQRTDYPSIEAINGAKSAPTPADAVSEWNSFIQSNPMLGHSSNIGAVSSPALAPAQLNHYSASMSENRRMDARSGSYPPQPIRPASIPPANAPPPVAIPPASRAPSVVPTRPGSRAPAENAPSPAPLQSLDYVPQPPPQPQPRPARPSRPASRSRSKQPTGRPRGRPRKRPLETGNTSAAEEATDGDDGSQKKRAKVIRTEYSAIAPFGAVPDSLRVAASTSGSLRAMRPVGAGGDIPAANHLQDIPRAPTPIPDAPLLQQQQKRRGLDIKARTDSLVGMGQPAPGKPALQNPSQDARSPVESVSQSPDHGYSPEDSAGDLGSSPPVPRTSAYIIQYSPPTSSPVLPTMPVPHLDSGFMSGGLDDFFDEDDILQQISPGQMQDQMLPVLSLPVPNKTNKRKKQSPNYPFQEVNPGPPELLPTKSLFNPAGKAKTLNRPAPAPPSSQPMPKKATNRALKRSNTAPTPTVSEQEPHGQRQPNDLKNGNQLQQDLEHAPSSNGTTGKTPPMAESAANVYAEVAQRDTPTPAMLMPIPERPELDPVLCLPTGPPSRSASRPASRGLPLPAVPASDPVMESVLTLPRPFMSEAPGPAGDLGPLGPRFSKNLVKKQTIKERLENAIQKGESPPFCNNCGAIETPTWRKIWTRDHKGVPSFHEFSDKPGAVTMIDITERDSEGQPAAYRMVKKNLGTQDDKKEWTETLLCNPCGIWLGKFKVHRPPDRWDKDAARLNQPRKKREYKGNNSRSKKARTKSDAKGNPTSEAYLTTDPIGPPDHDSPDDMGANGILQSREQSTVEDKLLLNLQSSPKQRLPGSTHSRGSGTADSPIAVEDDLGRTRRLLFPSPRKDGVPKVLGELAVNSVQKPANGHETKSATAGKENTDRSERRGTPVPDAHDDLEQELFGTPPRRPSTPPPKAGPGPFKTPTRPTPSHRPITRSISRSIRSIRALPKSPGNLFPFHLGQRTPSKTPDSSVLGSGGLGFGLNLTVPPSSAASRRRTSPRHAHHHHQQQQQQQQQQLHAHFAVDDDHPVVHLQFDSPFTATLNQLLSEANDFTAGSPAHGLGALELSMDAGHHHLQQHQQQHQQQQDEQDQHGMDFGNFLGGDLGMGLMPSSPPMLRGGRGGGVEFGGVLMHGGGGEAGVEMWGDLGSGRD
ncbi:hypothetical protein BT67DRAFT_447360 [Trichocladium antarcticum]|uniref:Ams2/SPT21 N-terminal domain-containing protein n=1 Tax=Trichocladium antarcticum TaxID=1450529 RepID=A0AAN6URE6_9PEZI|nr:hypothetical protein BT67DRAFT_447360 [Trichocladium antarcticum]